MEVLTHGLATRPRSTAFWARRPAAISTDGFGGLVQEVTEAIETMPWSIEKSLRLTWTGLAARPATCSCAGARPPDSLSEACAAGSEAGKDPAVSAPFSLPSCAAAYAGSTSRKDSLAAESTMRSCGRLGPAIEGTTVERSSSRYSE